MQKRLLLTMIVSVALAACGGHSASSASAVANTSPIAAAASPTAPTSSPPALTPSPAVLTAKLTPEHGSKATGTATVTASGASFTVRLEASGLQPGTTHPAHIHTGACGGNGPVVYALENLVANGSGGAVSTTWIHHPYQVPASGWSLNVHQGPTMSGAGETPIACAKLSAR